LKILLKFKNNKYNFYNKLQRFARTSPLRGQCRPRVAACKQLWTTLRQDNQQDKPKAKRSISWYPFSPWQNSGKLGSAQGLSKALYYVVYLAAGY